MSNKIAVIVNTTKELSSFEAGSNINVYCKYNDKWQLKEEIVYSYNTSLSLADIRDYIRTVILKLEDCKIVIAQKLSGLPYNIFDRMGFEIFEAESISDALLDEILSDIEDEFSKYKASSSSNTSILPIETAISGIYFLNLIELQEKRPEISSKKALQAFIETTLFYKLEVLCSHIPPWFDNILPTKKLSYSSEEVEKNKYKVTIYKKVCEC